MVTTRSIRSSFLAASLILVTTVRVEAATFVQPVPDQLSLRTNVFVRLDAPLSATVSVTRSFDGTPTQQNPVTLTPCWDPLVCGDDWAGVIGTIPESEVGWQTLTAQVTPPGGQTTSASVHFEVLRRTHSTADQAFLNECGVLNDVECLLPWPSTRYQNPAFPPGGNATEFVLQSTGAVQLPNRGFPNASDPEVPQPLNPAISAAAFNGADGFSPTAQILMHIPVPAGRSVSLSPSTASGKVSRLLPDQFPSTAPPVPWEGIRTQDGLSVSTTATSPTLLLEVNDDPVHPTATRVLHWMELDSHATSAARQALIMRPGRALKPQTRYIVVVRNLRDSTDQLIQPEAAFDLIRKFPAQRLTDIPQLYIEAYYYLTHVAPWLQISSLGIDPATVQLAFDFRVRSDATLGQPLEKMRDAAYQWVDSRLGNPQSLFTVTDSASWNIFTAHKDLWWVSGCFQSPLFLSDPNPPYAPADPEKLTAGTPYGPRYPSRVIFDQSGNPVIRGETCAEFTIVVPGKANQSGSPPLNPILLGHGNLQNGYVIAQRWHDTFKTYPATSIGRGYVAGATPFRGLSKDSPASASDPHVPLIGELVDDQSWLVNDIIGPKTDGTNGLNDFSAWRDRLGQGVINSLVLARLMDRGVFNAHPCFQKPPVGTLYTTWADSACRAPGAPTGAGVFPASSAEDYYWGVSLGGGNGTLLAGLSTDFEKVIADVGAIDYSLALQRSTAFTYSPSTDLSFEDHINAVGITDAMKTLLFYGQLHEIWVMAESAAFVGKAAAKVASGQTRILQTNVWLDKQVSNQASEIMARSLGLGQLSGSVQKNVPEILDLTTPRDSGLVMYHTGFLNTFVSPVPTDPRLPPLGNAGAPNPTCESHGRTSEIFDAQKQLFTFLQPLDFEPGGGRIQNYCSDSNNVCDGSNAQEKPSPIFNLTFGAQCPPNAPLPLP